MERTVTATEANREFSRILGEVAEGETYIVTARGKPVARITPAKPDEAHKAAREEAWIRFVKEAARQPAVNAGPWTREELYER